MVYDYKAWLRRVREADTSPAVAAYCCPRHVIWDDPTLCDGEDSYALVDEAISAHGLTAYYDRGRLTATENELLQLGILG